MFRAQGAPKAHADPQWQSLGVWGLMGLWSYSCMISATTRQGALSWGDRGQLRDSYEVWENPMTLRHPNAMDVLSTHSQMISLTMWQTSLCLKKLQGVVGNGTVAWQCVREILLLSLVSCCVCVCVFSDENCMWFLGKNRSSWAGVRSCQLSLCREI